MPTDSQHSNYHPPALEFKSTTFSAPVLVLANNDVIIIEHQLQEKIQLAPEFFKNSPVVIDLQELNKQKLDIDINELVNMLHSLDFLPIGIRGATTQQLNKALDLSIPAHTGQNQALLIDNTKPQPAKPIPTAEDSASPERTTLIIQPIRSGQRIYAHGDLIVLAQVSAGAEILAEGNIHVYGSLRGRALAGVQGNIEARIFCSDLQAELISIAGTYKISEDLTEMVRNRPVQICLQNNTLTIKDL
ncbi:MAG: septum site-determining protein MinC [Methylococcaceae bacterium]|nr:septum site-determining protein MinC [Methylococcaceae bacterium]MDZ4157061.1 septum site-determining protein MinC [Methylococcales bacterium]MDP2394186.1 septum site-determining protein MinC [Methylococcaceae bacterium]MDP3020014.1 septum site-determining protein MinC [Methylococcaceae bacterium]MDP3388756.1 septum site-determining protein MinC [Methylococcaceae bacterium]